MNPNLNLDDIDEFVARVNEMREENKALRARNDELEAQVKEMQEKMAAIETWRQQAPA